MLLEVRVKPGSSRSGPVEVREGKLVLRVHAAPEGGKANREVLKVLSRLMRIPPSQMEMVRGSSSRDKTILLRGVTLEEAEGRLLLYLNNK